MDEAMTGNFTRESDEAQDWESDEAIAESDESAEDIGERTRRRRQPIKYGRFVPISGRKGVVVRGPGGTFKTPFDTPIATAAEVNRGLAGQAMASSELAERLDRAERRFQEYKKNTNSATGLVSTGLIAGMAGFAAFRVAGNQTSPSGSRFKDWANENLAKGATVAAVAQLGLSASQFMFTRQWPSGPVSITAIGVSAVQIVAFTIGSFFTPTPTQTQTRNRSVIDRDAALAAMNAGDPEGTLYRTAAGDVFQVVFNTSTGAKELWPLYQQTLARTLSRSVIDKTAALAAMNAGDPEGTLYRTAEGDVFQVVFNASACAKELWLVCQHTPARTLCRSVKDQNAALAAMNVGDPEGTLYRTAAGDVFQAVIDASTGDKALWPVIQSVTKPVTKPATP